MSPVREKDIKLLWGRAAGRCSICRQKVTQDIGLANAAIPLGEHAHIVGEKSGSARFNSVLTKDERDGYTNRILLCPNDHTVIDKSADDWPVERLHMAKADHELYVELTLGTERTVRDEANALIYSAAVDATTERLRLGEYSVWAYRVLEPGWRWRSDVFFEIERLRQEIVVTDWPGTLPDLEVALDRASFELNMAAMLFTQHSELDGEDFIARRWYKAVRQTPEDYAKLDSDFWLWSETLEQRVREATKALNWAREVWRAKENPMWLATTGWFTPFLHVVPKYTDDEKEALLTAGVGAEDIRAPKVARR